MSQTRVKRKVVKWVSRQPPREWFATLTCGHPVNQYDDAFTDEDKARIDAEGGVDCYECGRKKDRVAELKAELAELTKD